MKKIFLFALLFYVKILNAQSFYLGGSGGFTEHYFRQQPLLAENNYSLGLDAQCILKDSSFGVDANFYYFRYGEYSFRGSITNNYWIPFGEFATADYFFFNPLSKSKKIFFQIKAGLFYSHYFTEDLLQSNDFGPAISLGFDFKISGKSYLCFEPTWLCGLQRFFVTSETITGDGSLATGYSNMNYYNFSIKFIHKI